LAREVWFVRLTADGSVLDSQLVGGGCAEDTPYGDACDGLPVIRLVPPASRVAPTATVAWWAPGNGCGGWSREGGNVEVSLDTLSAVRRSEHVARTGGPTDTIWKSWDFARLAFSSEWETAPNDDCPARKRGPFVGVPKMELPIAFVDAHWKSASIQACATTLNASRGVALPGTRKSKAILRALVSTTDALFVEVEDLQPSPRPASLQVCVAEMNARMYDYCQVSLTPQCVRVAMDGRRLSGTLAVETAEGAARLRIQLPPEMQALSIAYLDGRGGSIATSAYRSGDVTSLGDVFPLGPAQATCAFQDEQLHFVRTPRTRTRALLDTEGLE
jgi:hypothetical protein